MAHGSPLTVHGLVKRYKRLTVLRGINMVLERGDKAVIVGPNGSGKTTLIRCLLGFTAPASGKILVYGYEPRSRGFDRVRRRIGYMPEGTPLSARIRVGDYLDYVAELRGCRSCSDAAATMDLQQKLDYKIGALSQGLKRRLLLASALCCDPELLILDEPYANIDISTRLLIDRVLAGLDDERTLLITTHVRPRIGDYKIYALIDGRLEALGEMSDEGVVAELDCGGRVEKVRVTVSGRGLDTLEGLIRQGCRLTGLRPYVFEDMLQELLVGHSGDGA